MKRWNIKPKEVFICIIALSYFSPVFAELPSPLNLKTALSFAKDHPRVHLTPEQNLLIPQKKPLFLDCHNLIFSNTSVIDNSRNSVKTALASPEEQQKLYIMQAYYDVLLADSSMIGINEDMAGAYIAFDRAKTRQEYQQISEVSVAKLEAKYQDVRQQFFSGEAVQRITRSQLAIIINHPNELSSDLNPSSLIELPKHLENVDTYYQEALKNNHWLNALESTSNKDQLKLLKMNLKQEILELLLRIKVLRAARERSEAESYRRDLNLDLSRALYELEVKSSLGRSMTLQSKAQMNEERLNYCQNMTWAQLNILRGRDILSPPQIKKDDK